MLVIARLSHASKPDERAEGEREVGALDPRSVRMG